MKFMETKVQLETDLREAMRNKDELRKRTLRQVLSAIKLAEIEKGGALDEPAILSILQKEVKSRQEAIADAQRAGRPELVEDAQAEIAVLENYLPQSITAEQLEELAQEAIAEVGATSPREMGQVMKVLMPRIQGRASGSDASQMVLKLLG
jgi:uncharacterized protein YqeY